jgi:Kef-type K+ transport system membrane component KefB
LEFFGNSFFIPIFFAVTGFLIDPVASFQIITTNFPLASAVIGALVVGKWIAAEIVGRTFAYTAAARMTMCSLTLPQVAATLAAALVAFNTRNPAGQQLVDSRLLNVVLLLMLTTSILGPVLTEHFAPRLLDIDEVQAGRSAPMTQQSRLDVLALERLSKKRVSEEINLADGEVVRRAPVGVHFA